MPSYGEHQDHFPKNQRYSIFPSGEALFRSKKDVLFAEITLFDTWDEDGEV